jgi:hypothetical protein
MTDEFQLLETEIELGIEAKKFIKTVMGNYLLEMADAEARAFQSELSEMDCSEERTSQLRCEIKARRLLNQWLIEAINQAEMANIKLETVED